MDEKSLYAHILNLIALWQVKYLTLDENAGSVTVSYGSSSPSVQRYIPSAQHVVPHTAAHGTICCVVSLDCDALRRSGKQRYDFLSVVHFRKVVYSNKVGAIRNGNAVIMLCFYKSDFNFYWLT